MKEISVNEKVNPKLEEVKRLETSALSRRPQFHLIKNEMVKVK